MATALNLPQSPLLRTLPFRRAPKSTVSIRATSSSSETPLTSTSVTTEQEQKQGLPSSSVTFAPPPDFKPPEPKRFGVRPDKTWDILGLLLPCRSGSGQVFLFPDFKVKETSKLGPRPEKPIEIYEFESCPFCRKVREIVAVLDLDVLFYPCPKNGPNFRPKVSQMGGKQQFPYMVDPNTGVAMYESDDIIKYLVGKYGFAMIGRMGKGSSHAPSKLPPKPLEIWAYEGSPFCKLVREVLVELELPHLLRNCARGSPKRQMLYEKAGHFQVPYLEDPNTGVQMFESAEIVEYLRATYALQ